MNDETRHAPEATPEDTPQPHSWWHSRTAKVLLWIGVAFIVVISLAGFYASHLLNAASPLLRKRIIATLEQRYHSPAELDALEVSLLRGLEVRGSGLRVLRVAGDMPVPGSSPMLSVDHFKFNISTHDLLHNPTHIGTVYVEGLQLRIPPASQRGPILQKKHKEAEGIKPGLSLTVDQIKVTNALLVIETDKPGKDPLEFQIQNVVLNDVGADKPFTYDATVVNPKPTGLAHAVGHFGPWNGDTPRNSPIDGDYTFDHADMNSIKGIGGTLASKGHFAGQLGYITIDGYADVPNFSIDIANKPMPLHTDFHAYVDGTSGDTTLDPVKAVLGHSPFTAAGTIFRVKGKGHDIALDVTIPGDRIDDFLNLAVKSRTPLMRGTLRMKTKLHIPPGQESVSHKIQMAGTFDIEEVRFSNAELQDKIDGMSMRAQNRAKEAKEASTDRQADVHSTMTGKFDLRNAELNIHGLEYTIPGAVVSMDGKYTMDGRVLDFHGHVQTHATASEMVTGWKSLLVMPFDHFLKKNGAGMQLPIKVTGTGESPKFGLDINNKSDVKATDPGKFH